MEKIAQTRYIVEADNFSKIPGSPIAYWVSEKTIVAFGRGKSIDEISEYTGSQNITSDNERFLRFWWEASESEIGIGMKWVFYMKGGQFRKWYGNIELIVDWSEDATHYYKTCPTANLLADKYRFKEGITYTELTSGINSFRYLPPIAVFDKKGPSIVEVQHLWYCLAFFNSVVARSFFRLLNPTITLQIKDVKNTPLIIAGELEQAVDTASKENVDVCKADWDSFEASWEFKKHPLI